MATNIQTAAPIRSEIMAVIPQVKLTPEFFAFVNWKATPRRLREQETQKEFAKKIGVCEDTLTDWKKHPRFNELVNLAIRSWVDDRVPDVIDGLYEKIVSGQGGAADVRFFIGLAKGETETKKK